MWTVHEKLNSQLVMVRTVLQKEKKQVKCFATHFVVGEIEDSEVLGLSEEVGQLVQGGQSVVGEVNGLQLGNVLLDDLKL